MLFFHFLSSNKVRKKRKKANFSWKIFLFFLLTFSLSRDLVVNRIERRRHFIYSTRAFDRAAVLSSSQREEEEEEEEEETHRQRKRREMWMSSSSSSSLSSSVGCCDAFKTAQRVQHHHHHNNNNNRIRFRRQSRRSLEWALGRRGVARGVVNEDAISSAGEQQQ